MSERLIIRLASEASQKQHWLIWSEGEKEIIASGDIDNAEQLKTLTEKAASRHVICLLPGVDVCIKEVPINGTFNRQMQKALPYLIEEELAGDVEKLHFSVIAKRTDLVHVAVCDKQRMYNWLGWLADAQISCKQFIPEGLALPTPADRNWQAVQLDNHWIVRESKELAWSSELSMFDVFLSCKIEQDSQQTIESYSPLLEERRGDWVNDLPTLPMELLSVGALSCKVNLLSGEFKVKKETNQNIVKWRLPAILAALFFVISCVNLYMENRKMEAEVILVKGQVESVYKLAFPSQKKLRYTRVKKKLKTMLSDMNNSNGASGFLVMLGELAPTFKSNKALTPSSLKYDEKKQEMRILGIASNFQAFEKFSTSLPQQYSLKQGALNSSKNQVSGLLTIRKK
ncbi:type II secretion system protein GspL [Psychromonas sp. Urea-02u-13]|uniref:type II secretion system protein GspL n=1 Tax=Psychromonas sp. Urea-02u-13 TaxID=2058326 RepID=UPI000C32A20E|nr:type II secretion system protein GspL [Psychromonas sp. Urea-02u-13]PKG40073.1 type II secretion system protein GspL [Psychromonas sp. Urea-02u-13]